MRKITTLGEVATYINGRAFKPSEWETSGLPIIRIQNLNDPTAKYNYSNTKYEDKYLIKKGDLLFSWSASLGTHIWKNSDAWLNQHIFRIIPNENICKGYLYHFLCKVTAELYAKSHGTGMVHITKKPFMATPIPVPPLPEQERIVTRIEELFSELDKAMETLQTTKQQLAVYRQAVLKEAFSANAQADTVELHEIVDDIKIGPFGTMLHKSDYVLDGIPVINPQHIKNNAVLPSKNNAISVEKAQELSSYQLKENDIIIGRRGEMGRTAAITQKEAGWICGTGSMVFRLKPEFDAVFYAKILSSPNVVHYLEDNATGTTMKNLNEKIVRHIPVPLIPKVKQQQINSDMEMRMSICESIEQPVDTTLAQADAMRQSILKQAFEGGFNQ